jgi:hypothetical protein
MVEICASVMLQARGVFCPAAGVRILVRPGEHAKGTP